MIEIGTRKHGPFDPRFPRPGVRVDAPRLERSADRDSVDTWEGEGGHVEIDLRGDEGDRLRRSEAAALPSGLSWERFCALAYPGKKRHYFPAIAPWYRYRDMDRSRLRASPPGEDARLIRASTTPRPHPMPSRRSRPMVKSVKAAAPKPT